MLSVRPLPEFTAWLDWIERQPRTRRGGGTDQAPRLWIVGRLQGDWRRRAVRVMGLRIVFGAGRRLYYTQFGAQIVVLLAGGSKRTQKRDIKRAKALAALLKTEKDKDEKSH